MTIFKRVNWISVMTLLVFGYFGFAVETSAAINYSIPGPSLRNSGLSGFLSLNSGAQKKKHEDGI